MIFFYVTTICLGGIFGSAFSPNVLLQIYERVKLNMFIQNFKAQNSFMHLLQLVLLKMLLYTTTYYIKSIVYVDSYMLRAFTRKSDTKPRL